MENYETVKRLAVGAHGAVYLMKHTVSNKYFALKKIEVDERKKTKTKEMILKEARIMSQLRHPHIVLFHESFLDPSGEYVCIILDYCDGGSLSERIQHASQTGLVFYEKQVMQWFIQIVMAVQYIHSKHILHRDLKTENVLLNKRDVIKLGDFGISKILDSSLDVARTVVGTPSYLSPELCQDIPYNSKSDIWAVGCLLYEMCALHPPFEGQSLIGLFLNIVKAEFKPLPDETSSGIKDLVSQILVKTPEARPSASAILNQHYVKCHLASFIADTENICSFRRKRDQSEVLSSGDHRSLVSSSGIIPEFKKPVISRSPQNDPKSKNYHKNKLCCFSPQNTTLDGINLHYNEVNQSTLTNSVNFHCNQVVSPPLDSPIESIDKDNEAEYSDDFDDSSTETEEEILQDVDNGEKKTDEDDVYVDDFEENESDEDLEEVIHQAKKAQVLEPVDEYFIEERDDEVLTLTQTQFFKSHVKILKSQISESSEC